MDEQINAEIVKLKEYYQNRKNTAGNLEELAGEPLQHHFPVDLWQLSDSELDGEMGKRLSFLNEDIDCRPSQNITSHRRFIGPLIIFGKKIIAKILSPYTNTLFVRQNRFNEQLVSLHLATFIRCRRLEEKIRQLNSQIQELKEQQQETAIQSQALPNSKK
jgi:O-antigen chain-terminating methyltransferase